MKTNNNNLEFLKTYEVYATYNMYRKKIHYNKLFLLLTYFTHFILCYLIILSNLSNITRVITELINLIVTIYFIFRFSKRITIYQKMHTNIKYDIYEIISLIENIDVHINYFPFDKKKIIGGLLSGILNIYTSNRTIYDFLYNNQDNLCLNNEFINEMLNISSLNIKMCKLIFFDICLPHVIFCKNIHWKLLLSSISVIENNNECDNYRYRINIEKLRKKINDIYSDYVSKSASLDEADKYDTKCEVIDSLYTFCKAQYNHSSYDKHISNIDDYTE